MRRIVPAVATALGGVVLSLLLLTVQASTPIDNDQIDLAQWREGSVTLTYERDGRMVTEEVPSDRVVIHVSEEDSAAWVRYRPWWALLLAVVAAVAGVLGAFWLVIRNRRTVGER